MNNNYIIFQKQRDLGEIITDTFRFIRENFKQLFKMIFRVTGPVFVILIFALGYYSYFSFQAIENPILGLYSGENMDMYLVSVFILVSSLVAYYVLLYLTILHFIQSYIQNDGKVNETQVYHGVKNGFGGMLGLMLLMGAMLLLGLLLCILPGIFLWVPLSMAPALMVFKQKSVLAAIEESFTLIKDNWWMTFLTLFVIVLLLYFIGLIFQVPMIFYIFFKAITNASEIKAGDPGSIVDWVTITLNVLASIAQYVLAIVLVIASAFIYHHLDEKKFFTGSYRTISELGSSETH